MQKEKRDEEAWRRVPGGRQDANFSDTAPIEAPKRGHRVFLASHGRKALKRTQPRAEAARNYIVTPRVFNLSANIRLPRVLRYHLRPPPPLPLRQLRRYLPPRFYNLSCVLTLLDERDSHRIGTTRHDRWIFVRSVGNLKVKNCTEWRESMRNNQNIVRVSSLYNTFRR